jgi:hypothetical protein
MSEPDWEGFYGRKGYRWKICVSEEFVHFKVKNTDGSIHHKLARISSV